ncbi:hypothetical protein D3C85_1609900 [compost metagenome]
MDKGELGLPVHFLQFKSNGPVLGPFERKFGRGIKFGYLAGILAVWTGIKIKFVPELCLKIVGHEPSGHAFRSGYGIPHFVDRGIESKGVPDVRQ